MLGLWIQTISSLCMLIIILLVQLLIYPQFKYVNSTALSAYSTFHTKHISFIVVPIMLAELFSLIFLWFRNDMRSIWLGIATILLLAIWAITFLKIVPIHKQIASFSNVSLLPQLIELNAVRTLFWIIKSMAIFALFAVMITPSLYLHYISQSSVDTPLTSRNGYTYTIDKPITFTEFSDLISYLNAQLLSKEEKSSRFIVRTPYFNYPYLMIVNFEKKQTTVWSRSLLTFLDFGRNKRYLKWIQKNIKK